MTSHLIFIYKMHAYDPNVARSALCVHLLPTGQTTVAVMCNKI